MKPPPLEYVRATDVAHAVDLLAQYEDEAKPVAGGQSLVPLLNLRLARPAWLIDINDLALDAVSDHDQHLLTGALVRHRTSAMDPLVGRVNPLLQKAAGFIGHAAIRNRGTVGGSIVHADPAAELPLVAVACDATLLLTSTEGDREVGAGDFFVGPFMTEMQPNELLVGVRWPTLGTDSFWGFSEIAERAGDFATAAAAIVVRRGPIPSARVAVTGVPGSPARLAAVEDALAAHGGDPIDLRDLTRAALADQFPTADSGLTEYLRRLVEEMVVRAGSQVLQAMGSRA